MTAVRAQLLASAASLAVTAMMSLAPTAANADQLLTGAITSASGQKLEGVLVSANRTARQ